jgi:hypothetical protein
MDSGEARVEHAPERQVFRTSELRSPGILGSAMTPFGTPTKNLTPETVVEYQGMTMSLATAESIGLVTRTGDGRGYVESREGGEERVRQFEIEMSRSQQQDAAVTPQPFKDSRAEAALQWIDEKLPPAMRTALTEQALLGEIPERELNSMEATFGLEPGSLGRALSAASEAFEAQMVEALAAAGLREEGLEAFFEWAGDERHGQLLDAVRTHVYGRNTSKFLPLVREYFASTAPTARPDAWIAAGVPSRVDPKTGLTLVTVPGHPETDVHTAARLGLI